MTAQRLIKKLVFIASILFLCLSEVCLANPLPLPNPPSAKTILTALTVNSTVDFLVLLIGYYLIREASVIRTWKFLLYLVFVVIGGFLIDEFLIFIFLSPKGLFELTIGTIILLIFNYLLPRIFFTVSKKQASIIAILMGILTNPILYFIIRDSVSEFSW